MVAVTTLKNIKYCYNYRTHIISKSTIQSYPSPAKYLDVLFWKDSINFYPHLGQSLEGGRNFQALNRTSFKTPFSKTEVLIYRSTTLWGLNRPQESICACEYRSEVKCACRVTECKR